MAKSSEEKQKDLGDRIRTRRRQLGLSQEELARKMHKSSAAYVALIEAGKRNISTMDLLLLAKNLKISVSELVSDWKETPTVSEALRADKDLSEGDRAAIEQIYQSIKDKNNGNN